MKHMYQALLGRLNEHKFPLLSNHKNENYNKTWCHSSKTINSSGAETWHIPEELCQYHGCWYIRQERWYWSLRIDGFMSSTRKDSISLCYLDAVKSKHIFLGSLNKFSTIRVNETSPLPLSGQLGPFYGTKGDNKTRNGPVVKWRTKEHSRKATINNGRRASFS